MKSPNRLYAIAFLLISYVHMSASSNIAPDEFGYTYQPDTTSQSNVPVGKTDGTFDVSSLGAAQYTVPIKCPAGINGMQPNIAISYNSQAGNGVVGWGCNISGLSVITRGMKDIYHDGYAEGMSLSEDGAYYLDGKRLILASGEAGTSTAVYHPEGDPYTTVTVHRLTSVNYDFIVTLANGEVRTYGSSLNSRQLTALGISLQSKRIVAWYLDEVKDSNGNTIKYTYKTDNSYLYLDKVTYGHENETPDVGEINFSYETRPDVQLFKLKESDGKMQWRLKSVTSQTGENIYRTYSFNYGTSDGFSRLSTITEKNANGESLNPITLQWNNNPAFSQTVQSPNNDIPTSTSYRVIHGEDFFSGDFNGDGVDDIVDIQNVEYIYHDAVGTLKTYKKEGKFYIANHENNQLSFTNILSQDLGADISNNLINCYAYGHSFSDYDGDGINDFLLPRYNSYGGIGYGGIYLDFFYGKNISNGTVNGIRINYPLNTEGNPILLTSDLTFNGKTDVLIVERGKTNGYYRIALINDEHMNESSAIHYDLTLPKEPQKAFIGDYNNDGLQDLIIFHENGYKVFYNRGTSDLSAMFSDTSSRTETYFTDMTNICQGDFNGDGLSDFLIHQKKSTEWSFALNRGSGYFGIENAYNLPDDNKAAWGDYEPIVFDYNNDGKSDVVFVEKAVSKSKGSPSYTRVQWLHSNGSSLILDKTATSQKLDNANISHYMLGNFTGLGQLELMNYGFNCYNSTNANTSEQLQLYHNPSLNAGSSKIKKITDSFGQNIEIAYSALTDPNVYTKEVGQSTTYPLVSLTLPMHAVSSVKIPNGYVSSQNISYTYGGLKAHMQGKGIVGMNKQTITNNTLGTTTENNISKWNLTYYIPQSTSTITSIGSEQQTVNKNINFIASGSNNYSVFSLNKTVTDFDNNVTTTYASFDTTRGVLTSELTEYGSDEMYREVDYEDYVLKGNHYVPMTVRMMQKHADDSSEFSDKTTYEYDNKGNITRKKEHADSSLPLTTSYTYDSWGNILSTYITGNGVWPISYYNEYDATHRFVTKTYSSATYSPVINYTYDTWGNVIKETDNTNASFPKTTTNQYDGWGNLVRTVSPTGVITKWNRGWNNSYNGKFYVLERSQGSPWVKTYYDAAGREVYSNYVVAKGLSSSKQYNYNNKGQLVQESTYRAYNSIKHDYTYDSRGRIISDICNTGKHTAYQYAANSITTTENGRTYQKTFDRWGNVKTSSDPQTTVSYTYASCGKPEKVTCEGSEITMSYDEIGNQTSLEDPSAGTITYDYDAMGRVKELTDARNIQTTTTYGALGNILTRTVGDETTTYTYGTNTNGVLLLTGISNSNGSISYTYDNYGRQTSQTKTVNGHSLTSTYSYNSNGNIVSRTLPDNTTVYYEFDSYGYLSKIKALGNVVWEFLNNDPSHTRSKALNSLMQNKNYNSYLLLTKMELSKDDGSIISNQAYSFNTVTGNLTSRSCMSPQQTYIYDNLDRLTAVCQGSDTLMTVKYGSNGNITSKTGVGNYYYNTNRRHAVIGVSNAGNAVPNEVQNIDYTDFGKIEHISEGANSMTFAYTPDEERFSSVLKYLNNIRRTVYYGDGYEEVSDDSLGNYSITYLGEDIIGVKRNNAVTYYYLLTDHQGSVLGIYDASGTEKYSATYDAWGQQTVTRNDIGFLRGYTGHEMMPEFKLINMNGRLYDPLLARFLSPDNYVQLPDFSQSLNRYTYCLNNPLKYTDPSGEMAFIAGVAGFLKGAHRVIFHKGKLSSLFKYPLKFIKNDFKITWGLTKGSATQLLSRFTWELPQTAIGYLYSDARNTLGHVDHVRYFDGATYVIRDSHKTEEGVTIGNYINISSPDGVPLDKNGHFSPMENPLYMHEYGHYIQSQEYGWGYLFSVGIPSLVSAGITNKGKRVTITELNINKPITISKHRTRWYERKANKKARDYFVNKYGVEWPYEEFPVDF